MGFAKIWTDEEDDFLCRLVRSGSSAGEACEQIEAVFGGGRSRNAVIGRASRLKLNFHGNSGLRSRSSAAQVAGRARGLAAMAERRKRAKSAAPEPAPAPEKSALPALKPPAKQKHNAHNIRVKTTRHLDTAFDEIRTQRLAEVSAFEAKLVASGGVNRGVLFLDRDMTKHCSAPMAGWDSAPITEKRVCGAPVEWRAVRVGGAGERMEPTSWCTDCRKRFTVAATDRRADLGKLASLDRSVRRSA